jgi:hypothetical protein
MTSSFMSIALIRGASTAGSLSISALLMSCSVEVMMIDFLDRREGGAVPLQDVAARAGLTTAR